MKHQVYVLLLCITFSLCANSDHAIADKSKPIDRFSYEDSFDKKNEDTTIASSWIDRNKNACLIAAGAVGCVFVTAYVLRILLALAILRTHPIMDRRLMEARDGK